MIKSRRGILLSPAQVTPSAQRVNAMEAAAIVLRKISYAALLFFVAISGCGNSCFSGFWNGNGSAAATSSTSCPLTKATGSVIIQMNSAGAVSAASAVGPPSPASPRPSQEDVQHIFVTLRGIEAHPSSTADDNSPGWQELVPDLVAHPMQLDLLAPFPPSLPFLRSTDSPSLDSPGIANVPATIPADEYRQLRLRLLLGTPSSDDLTPLSNACGNAGWNCIIFSDRSVRPLQFAPSESSISELDPLAEFHVTSETGADGVFRLLPDEVLHLSIEFDPASSVFFPSNAAIRLIPVFRIVTQTPPPAAVDH